MTDFISDTALMYQDFIYRMRTVSAAIERVKLPRLAPAHAIILSMLPVDKDSKVTGAALLTLDGFTNVSYAINKLCEMGLIVRKTDEHDRRIRRLHVTMAGRVYRTRLQEALR